MYHNMSLAIFFLFNKYSPVIPASALARARSRSPPTPSGRPNKVADGAVSFGVCGVSFHVLSMC